MPEPTYLPAVPASPGGNGAAVQPPQSPPPSAQAPAVQRPMPPAGGQPVTATAIAQQRPIPPAGGQPTVAQAANQAAASRRTRRGGVLSGFNWDDFLTADFLPDFWNTIDFKVRIAALVAAVFLILGITYTLLYYFAPFKIEEVLFGWLRPDTVEVVNAPVVEAPAQVAIEQPAEQIIDPVIPQPPTVNLSNPALIADLGDGEEDLIWGNTQWITLAIVIGVAFFGFLDYLQAMFKLLKALGGQKKLAIWGRLMWLGLSTLCGAVAVVLLWWFDKPWVMTFLGGEQQNYMLLAVFSFAMIALSGFFAKDPGAVASITGVTGIIYLLPWPKTGLLKYAFNFDTKSDVWVAKAWASWISTSQSEVVKLTTTVYALLFVAVVAAVADLTSDKGYTSWGSIEAGALSIFLWTANLWAPAPVVFLVMVACIIAAVFAPDDWKVDEGGKAGFLVGMLLRLLVPIGS